MQIVNDEIRLIFRYQQVAIPASMPPFMSLLMESPTIRILDLSFSLICARQ